MRRRNVIHGWQGIRAALLALAAGALAAQGRASADTDDEAVECARRALAGPVRFPWYDAQTDGVKPIEVRPVEDPENRRSRWQAAPPAPRAAPDRLGNLLEVLGWALLAAAIAVIAWVLVRAFLSRERRTRAADEADARHEPDGEADRMESLPFTVRPPLSDLLAEARRLYEAGDYGQAIIYLYSHLLVQLDKHQIIRLAKGKTNRQYLRELRHRPPLAEVLAQTMVAFEDVFFGRHRLDRDRFESCWSRIDEFHRQLERGVP